MKTKTYKVYKFNELTEEQKEKVIERYSDINVTHDWWEITYEDAERVGIKITGFDIDRGAYCSGKFLASAEETAHLIEKEHGESWDTFKTAKSYLADRDQLIETAEKDENGDFVDEYKLDETLDELDAEFLKSILEDYRIILTHEFEYMSSREAITETLDANDYDFTEDGKID